MWGFFTLLYFTCFWYTHSDTHTHVLSLSFVCVCVCAYRSLHSGRAGVLDMSDYPLSVISPRIATLIPFSLVGSWPPPPLQHYTRVCLLMQVHACVRIYNWKRFRVGLVAGMQADQVKSGTVFVLFLVMHAHVWRAYRTRHSPEICNPDYAAFH